MDWIAFAKVASAVCSFPLFHVSLVSGKIFLFEKKIEIDRKMVPAPILYKVYALMTSMGTAYVGFLMVNPICKAIGIY